MSRVKGDRRPTPASPPVAHRRMDLLEQDRLDRTRPARLPAYAAEPDPGGTTYVNPVLDWDFPDPMVLFAPDGWYYAYGTEGPTEDGSYANLRVAQSKDLVTWKLLGDILPNKPTWASKTQEFWAPHVVERDGKYTLYYSALPDVALADSSSGICLAVATSNRPEGPFVDQGEPLQCGPQFVNIDPMAFDDPQTGKRLLYWGSGFEPIKVRELAPDGRSFAPGSEPIDLIPAVPDSNSYQRLVEGAWVIYRAPWYYLFYSGDNCCGPDPHYAVMVARSKTATGPFETLAAILESLGPWVAPGHNSVIQDASGADWIVYHARRQPAEPGGEISPKRVLLIDRLVYKGGWPQAEPGAPSSEPRSAPAADAR
jgi:arabinan endo-1,5-alpha-L-arabinosidase